MLRPRFTNPIIPDPKVNHLSRGIRKVISIPKKVRRNGAVEVLSSTTDVVSNTQVLQSRSYLPTNSNYVSRPKFDDRAIKTPGSLFGKPRMYQENTNEYSAVDTLFASNPEFSGRNGGAHHNSRDASPKFGRSGNESAVFPRNQPNIKEVTYPSKQSIIIKKSNSGIHETTFASTTPKSFKNDKVKIVQPEHMVSKHFSQSS